MFSPKRRRSRQGTGRVRPARMDRSLVLTLIAGLALLLVVGLIFSVAYGTRRITATAESLHEADESLRSATVARAQVAMAVHLAMVDDRLGASSAEARRVSETEALAALDDLRRGVHLLTIDGAATLAETTAAFSTLGQDVVAALRAGEVGAAQAASDAGLDHAFRSLADELVRTRDELRRDLQASDQLLGRIGNGARFLVAFLIPMAVILVYRELIKRQQRQAELETRLAAEQELSVSRKAFLANASHELRTPLTAIMGVGLILSDDDVVAATPALAELVGIVVSEAEDLNRMVDDLLTMARLDAGALNYVFEVFDPRPEVEDVAAGIERVGLQVAVDCEPTEIHADRGRLRQVIRNLLSNARKYGGEDVEVRGHVEGRTYVLDVSDDGPGIPEELAPRLFERFIHQGHATATKDSVGLGLSIAHALCRGMGGSVRYQRAAERTHFVVRLPLAEPDQAAALGDAEPAAAAAPPAPVPAA